MEANTSRGKHKPPEIGLRPGGLMLLLVLAALIAGGLLYAGTLDQNQQSPQPDPVASLVGTWQLQQYSGRIPYPSKKLEFSRDGTYKSRQDGGPVTSSGHYSLPEPGRLKMVPQGVGNRLIYIVRFSVHDEVLDVTTQDCQATYRLVFASIENRRQVIY